MGAASLRYVSDVKMRRPLGEEGFGISDWGLLENKKNSGGIVLVEVILAGACKCLFADTDGRPRSLDFSGGQFLLNRTFLGLTAT